MWLFYIYVNAHVCDCTCGVQGSPLGVIPQYLSTLLVCLLVFYLMFIVFCLHVCTGTHAYLVPMESRR